MQRYKIDFSNAFGISDEQIVEEYKQADIISFPSTFEGFGMPIIEGQTVGRLVVTSDKEPMRSVAGGGAILVDPEDVLSIRNAIVNSVCDDVHRSIVVKKGIRNARRFHASEIIKEYCKLYIKLI